MKALTRKYRSFFIVVVLVLQTVAVVLELRNYSHDAGSQIFALILTILALIGLFGNQRHDIAAILNSLLVWVTLGWLFGTVEVVFYWALLSIKRQPATTIRSSATPTAGDDLKGMRFFARIPLLRIPIPWVWYNFDERFLTRTVFGKAEDPYAFNKMYDVRISDPIVRNILGTSFFSFKATKIHDDKETIWHGIDARQAEQILAEAKRHIGK